MKELIAAIIFHALWWAVVIVYVRSAENELRELRALRFDRQRRGVLHGGRSEVGRAVRRPEGNKLRVVRRGKDKQMNSGQPWATGSRRRKLDTTSSRRGDDNEAAPRAEKAEGAEFGNGVQDPPAEKSGARSAGKIGQRRMKQAVVGGSFCGIYNGYGMARGVHGSGANTGGDVPHIRRRRARGARRRLRSLPEITGVHSGEILQRRTPWMHETHATRAK